ncbi:Asp-tRNA(Asn)/Glu-tRNA(Gln) amidotransferase A subunit family amidase [Rhodoligotrophos appendicifer]|uniref:amidase n=1 Tax=Rhodoligotrophos appendicifer TaxID=987056 RepID=UPI0011864440|nr:amidase [Rhodoligotrophos appendicifer]
MNDLLGATATRLAQLMALGKVSPVDVVDASLAQVDRINPELNAFCLVLHEEARGKAKAAEAAVMRGDALGPLHGVPIAIKDLTATAGHRTTSGSKVFRDFVASEDAEIAASLLRAGAILIGKTTTPEFAYSGFTYSPLWGTTRNPWNPLRTSGGSSGGSAVAVATGCVAMAEGSDMGGSVRIPASCCGVIGLKPSLGRIPFSILPSSFESLAHFGPLARSCDDAALFLSVTQGPSDSDILSNPQPLDFDGGLDCDPSLLRVAISIDLGFYAVDPEVERNSRQMAERLQAMGATVREVELGWSHDAVQAWDMLWEVYLATHYGHLLRDHRDDLDPEVATLIENGFRINAVDLKRTEMIRTEMWRRLAKILQDHDALLCPTLSRPVSLASHNDSTESGFDARGRYRGGTMTSPFNLVSQCPVLSVPSGFTSDGLPTGLQIVGRRFDDLGVLKLGRLIESSWGHAGFPRPPIWEQSSA